MALTKPSDKMLAPGSSLTLATMQASTSGTSIDFTGIPAGTKEIVVMIDGLSLNGTSAVLIQLGDSGGVEATGYNGGYDIGVNAGYSQVGTSSTGIYGYIGAAARSVHGAVTFTLMDAATFKWAWHGVIMDATTGNSTVVAGTKALSAELDRVRFTTFNGTDTFDAGSINIAYK